MATKKKHPANDDERLSLYPLDPRMVLRRMLNTQKPARRAQKGKRTT